jgi:DNA-binding NtrC family response regulator
MKENKSKGKILIVEDDPALLGALKVLLEGEGFSVLTAGDGEAAQEAAARGPELVVLDVKLPDMSGLEVLKALRGRDPKLPVIMMTGYVTTETAIKAMMEGAYDYISKPFKMNVLVGLIDKAMESSRLMRTTVTPSPTLPSADLKGDTLIGKSPQMLEIYKIIGQVAQSEATVLIAGESGTGKELVARALYHHSGRKDRPFLAVNCAAIPETLLESELFGHEKGSFTGAAARKIGKFEQCNYGTIFLDEIGDMSLLTQAKVLRILQNQEFERVGGQDTIKVNVRVITATNKDLSQMVKEKTFRDDLYYRLKVVSVNIPPLRQRPQDIPLLAQFFLQKFNKETKKEVREISAPALERLMTYPWPGNVRELENFMETAMVLCRGEVLLPEHFPFLTEGDEEHAAILNTLEARGDLFLKALEPQFETLCQTHAGKVFDTLVGDLEKALLQLALKRVDGNQVQAAKLLGISRNTLRDRMERYGLGGE